LGVLIAFLNSFSAGYFQALIDRLNSGTLVFSSLIIYGGVQIILCIVNYVDEYPGRKLEHGIYLDLKLSALKKISRVDYQEYHKLGTGKLVQVIENGSEAGKGILFDFYFCLFRELIPSVLFSLLFIYRISKTVTIAILVGYIFVFLVTNILLRVLYEIKEKILTYEEKMNRYLVRGFMEMVVFRVNKRFKYEIEKATQSKVEIVSSKVKMKLIHEAFFTIFALLITIIKIAIIAYGWKTNALTVGAIIALITLIDNAYTPIAIFNVLYIQYKLDSKAFDRYIDFLALAEDEQLRTGVEVTRLEGDISFQGVNFSYGDRDILKNFDLTIQKGENAAFVGESGSGKSTIAKMLAGLLKPGDGVIQVDEYDLAKINLNSYYDGITYLSQESPVFDGTLRENIVFDKEVEESTIIEVLRKVNLYELYTKLENGLDTELGERGITLSGGERQRLALARIWFTNARIVILDEATSAMDNITEEAVMHHVMTYLSDRTVIVIAHRLNTVQSFHRIVALKEGKIVEQGSFEELMEKSEYFKELYYANVG
jgi:ATP-binding cassette subfamily B protein